MCPIKNENGYLLLEILLSITILSIIFTVFFGYFLQSRTHVEINKGIGSASQLSQEVLIKVRDSNYTSTLTQEQLESLIGYDSAQGIVVNNHHYFPKVYISQANTVVETQTVLQSPVALEKLNLITVIIEEDINGTRNEVYETYGYKVRDLN
ncbi:type II secretion system protein [Bacillus sp. DNRA2]|uniref:type IV pilus modification PilV family protein n=1 Tax=Bacillus sp. DNRA2 TaxID=2723053 RepID=UPI00145CC53A|nr:type II secretion system protein [Bacillus sp. DNRA2]NMD70532.1 type II secretion system protein [Bacillus sp. DNRA2]